MVRTGDYRAIIYGALLWIADKLGSDEREKALALWVTEEKEAFEDCRGVGIEAHA
ncbi:hypothetical protein ACVIJ6_001769 [Bradyrhizobium sp. USDA 4369]